MPLILSPREKFQMGWDNSQMQSPSEIPGGRIAVSDWGRCKSQGLTVLLFGSSGWSSVTDPGLLLIVLHLTIWKHIQYLTNGFWKLHPQKMRSLPCPHRFPRHWRNLGAQAGFHPCQTPRRVLCGKVYFDTWGFRILHWRARWYIWPSLSTYRGGSLWWLTLIVSWTGLRITWEINLWMWQWGSF